MRYKEAKKASIVVMQGIERIILVCVINGEKASDEKQDIEVLSSASPWFEGAQVGCAMQQLSHCDKGN